MKRPRVCVMVRFVLLLALAPLVPALAGPPLLPDSPGAPRLAQGRIGEEEQIKRRREWFWSTRRDGLDSSEQAAAIRRAEIRSLATRLTEQRRRRFAGAEAQQNFWVSMGPTASHFGGWAFGDVSGRITGIAKDSTGAVYIASAAGGVWKTTNDGLSWTNIFEHAGTQPTGAVAVDPNNDAVIWVGAGDFVTGCEGYFGVGMLRSADGGANWELRNGSGGSSLDDMSTFSSIIVDPRDSNHLVVGGTIRGCTSGQQLNGGLYTTSDGGLTWARRIADTAIHEIAQDPTNRDIYWAASNQGIWRSTNNAVTWSKQTASGLPSANTGRTELAVAPSDGNYVYALFENGDFWRTTNGGGSWSKMSSGACDGQCWYNMTLGVHRTNPNVVYRGTILLFKTTNGGTTWNTLVNGWGGSQQVHQDMQAMLVDPAEPNKFYIGSDGGMWKSSDGGSSFVNMNATLNLFLFYAIDHQESDPGVICGGAQDNSSLVRTTSNVWDLQAVTGDGFVCRIDPENPNYAYITSYPGSYPSVSRSTTGVLGSFSGITGAGSGIGSGERCNWVTPYTLDANTPGTLLLGTHRLYRSTDHGSHWSPVGPSDITRGGTTQVVEFNRTDSRVAYAGSNDGLVFRSADNGLTWADISGALPQASVNDVAGDPGDPERALAVLGGFNRPHLWEWTVARGTWVALGDGLPNVPANTVLMKTSSEIFVGTDIGIFRSLDGGATFEPFMDGLPEGLVVTDLHFGRTHNVVSAGTYGRGAYQVSVEPPGPMVMFDSLVLPLSPVDGDGDANVEPGETWEATPVLRNAGGVTALGVQARLANADPRVTILDPALRGYGDLAPGASGPAEAGGYTFVVPPSFPCGTSIVFDVVDITSTNEPGTYRDRPGAFSVEVVDNYQPNIPTVVLDEDFDPNPASGWAHEAIAVSQYPCLGATRKDEWKFATKDAAHGSSFHCGRGPGSTYLQYDNAWLYYAGKDSGDGPGIDLPAGAVSATLTLTHWYKTQAGADGGFLAVDASDDGQDVYVPISPVGGYPGSLATGNCNAQEGRAAFTGNSGGWVTSTFNLSQFIGKKIYLAFIFATDRTTWADEGWYVDRVQLVHEARGEALCQPTPWAATVPATATFARGSGTAIEASWSPSCNEGAAPGQAYSVQAGDLDALGQSGAYNHAPVAGLCNRTSPSSFAAGPGNEYYLVVPNLGGREGGAGVSSDGTPRPQVSAECGPRRIDSCP
ncbi:MAG: immune inhibitor A [Acidobacteria bacterium]|nr:immune inhibitor A [Acidobacteriota bacterium]